MLTGSLGMLASASLGGVDPKTQKAKALYEPVHGSRTRHRRQGDREPNRHDRVVRDGAALFVRMLKKTDKIEAAIAAALARGLRTADLKSDGTTVVGWEGCGKVECPSEPHRRPLVRLAGWGLSDYPLSPRPSLGFLWRGAFSERTGDAGDVTSLAMCDYRSGLAHRRAPDGPAHRIIPGRRPRARGRRTGARSAMGCASLSADCAAIFRAQEPNKRMKDKAARACRALCRARVADKLQRRRGTRIAEHLKLVLSIIDRQLQLSPPERRFPPPWSVEETDACYIVRDANGQALAYVYFEEEPGRERRPSAHPRRGAAHRRQHRQAAGAVEEVKADAATIWAAVPLDLTLGRGLR